ncbi:MAG: hypothetical protein MJ092_07045 [Lachnospiraceae bacterium]|nr:hypothetical protein [Lachnospiraceae bacterium]
MKRFVEIAWTAPIDRGLLEHLRNDLNFKDDHLKVFDSVTQKTGNADFHADNTGLDKRKFGRVYEKVAETVLGELMRLALIGYKHEKTQKSP